MHFGVVGCLVCSAWPAMACGGEHASRDSAGGDGSSSTVALPETCGPEVASGRSLLVDDFEDANLLLASDGELHGLWYVHNDGSGTQSPTADDPRTAPQLIDGPGSTHSPAHALHTSGGGFSGWGAFVATRLNTAKNQVCSVDLSAYSALQLSLRGTGSVRFNLGTAVTTPIEDGGACHQDACSDYGTSIALTDDWQDVRLDWASLAQPEWATPAAFDPSVALRLSFWAESPDFDLWIDDLQFRE